MLDYLIVYGAFGLVFAGLWVAYWRAGVRLRRDREQEQRAAER